MVSAEQNDAERYHVTKRKPHLQNAPHFPYIFQFISKTEELKEKFELGTEQTFLARKACSGKIAKSRSVLRIKAKYFGKARDDGGGTVTQCWQVIIARVLRLYAPSGRQAATYRHRRSLPSSPVSPKRFAFILEIERDFVVFPDAFLGTNVRSVACYESDFSTDLRSLK